VVTGARMTSSRPYLLRAIHEWLVDNGLTPQILVDAEAEGVEVPRGHVSDGRIVLNCSPAAVRGLVIDNQRVEFEARFAGVPRHVSIPIGAVLAIAARENGAGMSFAPEAGAPEPEPEPPGGRRPALKVVK